MNKLTTKVIALAIILSSLPVSAMKKPENVTPKEDSKKTPAKATKKRVKRVLKKRKKPATPVKVAPVKPVAPAEAAPAKPAAPVEVAPVKPVAPAKPAAPVEVATKKDMGPEDVSKTAGTEGMQPSTPEKSSTTFTNWWSKRNTLEKTAFGVTAGLGGALGLWGALKIVPKAFSIGTKLLKPAITIGTFVLTYLGIRNYFKDKDKSWGRTIKDDVFGVYGWFKGLFSSKKVNEDVEEEEGVSTTTREEEEEEEEKTTAETPK